MTSKSLLLRGMRINARSQMWSIRLEIGRLFRDAERELPPYVAGYGQVFATRTLTSIFDVGRKVP
ncbi:MAG: hypothetical protein ACJAQ3_003935, partial [Planctomycetota bacterium]